MLFCKGADSIVEERLSRDHDDPNSPKREVLLKSREYVDGFASEGLRTLFVA